MNYESRTDFELDIQFRAGGKKEIGVLIDEDLGAGPFRCRFYGSDLLLAGETSKIKLIGVGSEIKSLIRSGVPIYLAPVATKENFPVEFVPSMNSA